MASQKKNENSDIFYLKLMDEMCSLAWMLTKRQNFPIPLYDGTETSNMAARGRSNMYTVHFIFRFVSLLCLRSTLRLFQFWKIRPRTHGNVFLYFCIVSSNELVVRDSLENSKQYKNAGKRFRVYRA